MDDEITDALFCVAIEHWKPLRITIAAQSVAGSVQPRFRSTTCVFPSRVIPAAVRVSTRRFRSFLTPSPRHHSPPAIAALLPDSRHPSTANA